MTETDEQTIEHEPQPEEQILNPEAPTEEELKEAAEKASKNLVATGGQVKAIIPHSIDEAWRFAQMLSRARVVPASYDTQEKVLVGIVKGMELGLPPLTALQSIYVVNGRPTIWGDGAVAMAHKSGEMEDFVETFDHETETATCTIKRKGLATPVERSFSYAMAEQAGLFSKNKSIWKVYPQRMCQMRARSWALRDAFADVLMGLGITEEVGDTGPHQLVEVGPGRYEVADTRIPEVNPLDDDEGVQVTA